MKSTGNYSDEIKKLKKVIKEADAIVIGAGAGLSTSAGFDPEMPEVWQTSYDESKVG